MYDKETGIWDISIARRHKCDYFLALAILTHIGMPKEVVDLGCGIGLYCKFFQQMGCTRVFGMEGTPKVNQIGIFDDIYTLDLSRDPFTVKWKPDLVLCLEVGEHIPRNKESNFIHNVNEFVGKWLVLSWAEEGQYSASGHVNCRNNDYVISEFTKKGLKFDKGLTKKLRDAAQLKYFKNTVMVFKR